MRDACSKIKEGTRQQSAQKAAVDSQGVIDVSLKAGQADRYARYGVIGQSDVMLDVYNIIDHVKETDCRVVLLGESGTGKELFARIIHEESPRKDGPLVPVDCGALPPNLLESELFGYVRGAFTGANRDKRGLFEEANGGTLFLDEITNMPIEIQAKFLRALQSNEIRPLGSNQSRKIDARIITAASDNLIEKVRVKEFRLDLYYRLNVVPLTIPPLRKRGNDITLLAQHFLAHFSKAHNKSLRSISSKALKLLNLYPWPGNVRELENVIERAVVMSAPDTRVLDHAGLPVDMFAHNIYGDDNGDSSEKKLSERLADYEREQICKALMENHWNQSAAGRALGISERMIRYKIKLFGIRQ
ncbi:MAG: sigma 54-interacting transcriptional regulator [candidate division KSB1 bacterium]|jgi:transcriptional regulator with PAS, ATPase and Fis domain|nr:sigma 54-interacting transcriptional regulator [candidate division KSB1 bacterium]